MRYRWKFLVLGVGLVAGVFYLPISSPVAEVQYPQAYHDMYDRNGGKEVAAIRIAGAVFSLLGLFGFKLNIDERYGLNERPKKREKY